MFQSRAGDVLGTTETLARAWAGIWKMLQEIEDVFIFWIVLYCIYIQTDKQAKQMNY